MTGKSEVYLLYWYKSTNTDANASAMCEALKTKRSMRLHTAIYVSSYDYKRVYLLLYMCPHTTILGAKNSRQSEGVNSYLQLHAYKLSNRN